MTTQNVATDLRAQSASNFRIRAARREDMAMIAGFVRSSSEWYRPFVTEKDMREHDVGEAWAEDNFRRREFYVGEHRSQGVGTISLQHFGRHTYLGYIYLDVRHVGQGFGQRLMRFAERVSRARGMKTMNLIAHPQADWAKRAYLKYGFEIIETDRDAILSWNDGALHGYYEEGFELYEYELGTS